MASLFETFSKMAGSAMEPLLTNSELETILARFAVADAAGVAPSGPEWTPTYNLRAAAAEAWRWKAAKASEMVSTDLDGDRMSANQIFDQCERMIRVYSRSTASPRMGTSTGVIG